MSDIIHREGGNDAFAQSLFTRLNEALCDEVCPSCGFYGDHISLSVVDPSDPDSPGLLLFRCHCGDSMKAITDL